MKLDRKAKILLILACFINCSFGKHNGKSKNEVTIGDQSEDKNALQQEAAATEHPVPIGHQSGNKNASQHEAADTEQHGIHLISWRWYEYSTALLFTGMIVSAVICKIVFHHLVYLPKLLPESCALILVGIVAGVFTDYVLLDEMLDKNEKHRELIASAFPRFTANLFFNYLLPPIILDSALALYNRDFFDNVCSVLTFAVFGTLFNVFAIGLTLFGLISSGVLGDFEETYTNGTTVKLNLGSLECFVFSSLISAVDPVAVLAIFEDIQVNLGLYFLVFGESLLNDGVTVVLYNAMNSLRIIPDIAVMDIVMAFISFFFVVLGGLFIGVICGLFASFVTTWTKHVRVVEPLLIFCTAYFAFLAAELFHWSGIISIIGYGITAKRYGFNNLSQKSYTTVKYAIKTIATTCDCIIFLFLGVVLIQEEHYWHPGFIIATIIACLIYRFISTFLLSWICNFRRTHRITKQEQFIMAYGGLRGAVGFSLAVVIKEDILYRKLFVSTALAMVFFTVFLQGGTIKMMVKLLNIKLNEEDEGLITVDVQEKVMDDIMGGIETVMGKRKEPGCILKMIQHIDAMLKESLILKDSKSMLTRKFEKIILDEHFTNLYAPRILVKEISTDDDPLLASSPEEEVKVKIPKANADLAADRKMFQKGMQRKNAWNRNTKHEKRDIIKHLEMRAQRSKIMEAKVLKQTTRELEEGNDKNIPRIRVGSAGDANPPELKPELARSKSAGWMAVNRAGGTAAIIKLKYDQTQDQVKHKHPSDQTQDQAKHKHPIICSIKEEDEALLGQ